MSNVATAVNDAVIAAISRDELELPTLPEVALSIREAAQNEDIAASGLADVVSADPGLAASLVKIANSPMFRAPKAIEDLQMAISRLGVEYAANLATGLAMQQMFQATSEVVDRKLRAVWAHATEVAAISGVIAKHFTNLKSDEASLAGLVHSIGVLPILSWAEEHEGLINNSIVLDEVIETLHGELGGRILAAWDFPPEISEVPRQYTNFTRQVDACDYVDVITVAYLQSHTGSGHPCTEIDWNTVTAFARVGFDPEVEANEIEDISEDLEVAKAAFN